MKSLLEASMLPLIRLGFTRLNSTTPQKGESVELRLPPFLAADGPSDQIAWVELSSTALSEEYAPSTRAAHQCGAEI